MLRLPARGDFPLLQSDHTGCPRAPRLLEARHSRLFNAEVKNEWSHHSTPPYAVTACITNRCNSSDNDSPLDSVYTKLNVHYRVHGSLGLVPVLSQLNLVHTHQPYFLRPILTLSSNLHIDLRGWSV